MTSSLDLSDAADCAEAFLRSLRGRPRDEAPAAATQRRQVHAAAFAACITALRRATGARAHEAETWLHFLQTAVNALSWNRIESHRDELEDLLALVVNKPLDDERYAVLKSLVAARAQIDQTLSRAGTMNPDARARLAEQAKRAQAVQRNFVGVWNERLGE